MRRYDFKTFTERFESPDRAAWQRPDFVLAQLGDLAGKTVMDIGAGTGYFTFRLAERAQRVIAADSDPRFLEYIEIKLRAREEPLPIELRRVPPDDPLLADGEADIVLVVNTYHHLPDRADYFRSVRGKLKPGGFVAVVDFKKKELPVGPLPERKLRSGQVVAELRAAGFTDVSADTGSLEYQYLILAR